MSNRLTATTANFPQLDSQGIEEAVDSVINLIQSRLNGVIDYLNSKYKFATGTVELAHIMPNHYYTTELVEPWEPPACFVVADKTDHDLRVQNIDHAIHHMFVVVVVEAVDDILRLTRRSWRMGRALRTVLHDASFHNVHVLVRGLDYSPLYVRQGESNTRMFRKDVTVRVEVSQYEPMP